MTTNPTPDQTPEQMLAEARRKAIEEVQRICGTLDSLAANDALEAARYPEDEKRRRKATETIRMADALNGRLQQFYEVIHRLANAGQNAIAIKGQTYETKT